MGGLCIGDEWLGVTRGTRLPWRDTAVEGRRTGVCPARSGLRGHLGDRGSGCPRRMPGRVPPQGEAEVRVIGGEPGRERIYRVTELMAACSVSRLWITDAYLVAPPRLLLALQDAARDGVDVRLLLPGSSDLPLVRNLSRIGYRDLLRSGVRIYEWEGPMLHAKTIVADGRWSRIGSSNLNASSLMGNWELDVLIENRDLADAMEHQFRLDIAPEPGSDPSSRASPAPHFFRVADGAQPQNPEIVQPQHHKSVRERRKRAGVALRIVLANATAIDLLTAHPPADRARALLLRSAHGRGVHLRSVVRWLAVSAWREAFRRRADR